MQRQTKNKVEIEEGVKYYVNGIESKRDEIYQTIVDNKFYVGQINLRKEYRSKKESRVISESMKSNTSFHLNAEKFVEKFSPDSDEFKLLIVRMVHVLEMSFNAIQDYDNYKQDLRIAIFNCMNFLRENTTNCTAPYNNIMHKLVLEQFPFMFDILAFAMASHYSLTNNISKEVDIPAFQFDMSGIKEIWDESWSDVKKSQFLDTYLSVMLKQTEILFKVWIKNGLFSDKASKNRIREKFDEFKNLIKSSQTEKAELDVSVLGVKKSTFCGRLSSLFYPVREDKSPAILEAKPLTQILPSNGK